MLRSGGQASNFNRTRPLFECAVDQGGVDAVWPAGWAP